MKKLNFSNSCKEVFMSIVKRFRWLIAACLFIFLFLFCWGTRFINAYHQYCRWEKCRKELTEQIANIRHSLIRKKEFIHRAYTDNNFREKLLRARYGYIKKQEYIVRFLSDEEVPVKKTEVQF